MTKLALEGRGREEAALTGPQHTELGPGPWLAASLPATGTLFSANGVPFPGKTTAQRVMGQQRRAVGAPYSERRHHHRARAAKKHAWTVGGEARVYLDDSAMGQSSRFSTSGNREEESSSSRCWEFVLVWITFHLGK